ncbi:MAG TPA: MT-A70 family methyltransferase [Atribacterota bacterium]|nr:MT-A70 family methyltransferase [Atribacterota bacterium]
MNTLHIDPEFKSLIPPLSTEEKELLEKSILSEGCRDPLVVWQNGSLTLIDGHNRYEICQRNGIKYDTKQLKFSNKEEVKDWIITNQLGRRNLTDSLREYFRGKLYESRKKQEKGGDRKGQEYKNQCSQNVHIDPTPKRTIEAIAKEQKVSPKTVQRSYQYSQAIDTIASVMGEEVKQKILNEEIKVTKEEVKTLANKKPEEQKKIVEKFQTGEVKTVNQAILAVNRDKPREIKPLPIELYDVIYSDPPWRYEHVKNSNDSIEAHYPTMDLEEIKAMKVPAAENTVLLLWVTSPKLEEGLQVLNAWGFNYRSSMIWDKSGIESGKNWIGMGYWFRGQHELLLVGVKGKFSPPKEEFRFPSIYREFKTEHSKKPEFIYEMIEKMFPGHKYLELFARNTRENWRSWGNEVK